ncbi:hypothetical protein [Paenibacillus sp. FSL E2-0151]|uniref:hypothetical protein n=1 Tax=Paenibacillus sp. FSL E2-0151 TaxID=2921357 RepID=UPI0030EBFD6B
MPTQYRYIPQHKDGHFADLYAQPVEDYMKAVRFNREDDLEVWLTGRYGPDDPHNFRTRKMRVNYELEVEVDERTTDA